jgi:YVTN family beta-propeller protein
MHIPFRIFLVLFILALAAACLPSVAQTVIDTIQVGSRPANLAVNSVTNKIYVANQGGTVTVIDGTTDATTTINTGGDSYGIALNATTNKIYVANAGGTVTVIDGVTNSTRTVTVGGVIGEGAIAVNAVTNKIYVGDCGNDNLCLSRAEVTIIDGATLSTQVVPVGFTAGGPALAVDPVSNKIYVTNFCGDDSSCQSNGTVTAIDGATLATTTITVGFYPNFVAVNSTTNKVYVVNVCADLSCHTGGLVTVIDGQSNSTASVTVGSHPLWDAVNQVTNKIYVTNDDNTITVIDGATNGTATVPGENVPYQVQANSVTNKIYVTDQRGHEVLVIDGATNSTVTVPVGTSPFGLAVNSVTNRTYVANSGDDTVSVIAGASASALQLVTVPPCRVVDTRNDDGTFGGPPIQGRSSRSFPIPQGACGLPATAAAYSLNVTVVPHGPLGYLTIWPTGEDQPVVSTMNSLDGRIKANAAIVPAGYQGAVSIYAVATTDVVLDIDGYFAQPGGQTLEFYPLTPCRVADTRSDKYPQGLGTPNLSQGVARDFPVLLSPCIPSGVNAAAYSFNFTAIPYPSLGHALAYLEVWPTGGQPQHPVSTLNNQTGTYVANAAVVPAGTGGMITAFPSDNTDLAIDINGYFAAPGTNGLSLYPAAPCRVIDTRKIGSGQPFNGSLSPPVDVVDSVCGTPPAAQAYIFNATVVPPGYLGYLTLWPDSENQPVVSTLNAADGWITSNMAIVPNVNGKIDAYAAGLTQLILDISSYFAP